MTRGPRPLRRLLLVRPSPWKPRTASYPPLGCLQLASVVREWLDERIEVRLADMRAAGMGHRDLARLYREFCPDVVGFSTLSIEHADLIEAARLCKEWNPECLTIVGGPHASMFWDLLAPEPHIDVVVRGEGEHTLVEVLTAWADGRGFEGIPGVVFHDGSALVENGEREFVSDLDRLPLPAWDLLDIPRYSRANNMNGLLAAAPYMPVMTSRACPYSCTYCHRLFGTRFRARSVDHVLEELEILRTRFGIREIQFIDDCFNLRRERALEIARGMIERRFGLRFCFPNGVRSDRMDEELIRGLKEAGAYMFTFAVESANERIQELVRKNLDLDRTARAIDDSYRHGVLPAAFFMIGFPSETPEEMENTIRFACDSKILKAYFFNVVPFPRTELWETARQHYPEMPSDPRDISMVYNYWSSSDFYTRMTGIDIARVIKSAYRRFYFDPLRVARILHRFPKNVHLLRGVFYGLQASFRTVQKLNASRSASRSA